MDRAPVRRTPAPPEGHGSSWPTWRGAPLSFEGPGIVLFERNAASSREAFRHNLPGSEPSALCVSCFRLLALGAALLATLVLPVRIVRLGGDRTRVPTCPIAFPTHTPLALLGRDGWVEFCCMPERCFTFRLCAAFWSG